MLKKDKTKPEGRENKRRPLLAAGPPGILKLANCMNAFHNSPKPNIPVL